MSQISTPSSSPGEPLLSVTQLNVAFGGRVVIHNLSFQVRAGDCLAVIGPNGAGKTVLLTALLNLIPYQGQIRWSQGARLGYVPQKIAADRQLPLQLKDLMHAKASLMKLPAKELEEVFAEVGLTRELLNTSIGHLSGGQFQKALIAFALLGRPNVLLFDEPTASLDELDRRAYLRVAALAANREEHDGDLGLSRSQRRLSLCQHGSVSQQGTHVHGASHGSSDAGNARSSLRRSIQIPSSRGRLLASARVKHQ